LNNYRKKLEIRQT